MRARNIKTNNNVQQVVYNRYEDCILKLYYLFVPETYETIGCASDLRKKMEIFF